MFPLQKLYVPEGVCVDDFVSASSLQVEVIRGLHPSRHRFVLQLTGPLYHAPLQGFDAAPLQLREAPRGLHALRRAHHPQHSCDEKEVAQLVKGTFQTWQAEPLVMVNSHHGYLLGLIDVNS